MTTSRLPEIVLTCRNNHQFPTRARGGITVRCKTCGVPKHVPADRARSDRELAALGNAEPDQELAARWEREPEWDGHAGIRSGRDNDMCAGCRSVPVDWEPGRTLTYCPECQEAGDNPVSLPVAVTEHYERQEQASQEVATRAAAPDQAVERAARVQLRARKQQTRDKIAGWLDSVADPEMYDRDEWRHHAAELAALLSAYLPEIDHAGSEAELGVVLAEVNDQFNSQLGMALQAEWERAQQRARAAVERAEHERQRVRAEAEAEHQAAETERQAERQRQRQAAELAAQQRKAISSRPGGTNNGWMTVAAMLTQDQVQKAAAIQRKGACEWKHALGDAIAERVYAIPARDWQGGITGMAPGTTYYRACSKHFEAAEAQLRQAGYQDIAWWPAEDVANA